MGTSKNPKLCVTPFAEMLIYLEMYGRTHVFALLGRHTGVRAPIVAKRPGNAGGAKGAQGGGDVTDIREEAKTPAGAPKRATQARETQTRWGWVEPSVWMERMLTALERGVKGGKWFSLIDEVYTKMYKLQPRIAKAMRGTCFLALRQKSSQDVSLSTYIIKSKNATILRNY